VLSTLSPDPLDPPEVFTLTSQAQIKGSID